MSDARNRTPSRRPRRSLPERLRAAAAADLVGVVAAAPPVDPIGLVPPGEGDAFVYLPPNGDQIAATGRVAALETRGEGRFYELARQAESLAAGLEWVETDAESCEPLFVGGASFAPGGADLEPWALFGDASFVLPRWLYRRRGGDASLALFVRGAELRDRERRERWLAALAGRVRALARPPARGVAAAAGNLRRLRSPAPAETLARVGRLVRQIEAGHFEKVVTALVLEAELDRPADPATVLRRLALAARESPATPFLVRRGGASFVGASPELLVALEGDRVRSEALAGSRRSGRAGELAASGKEREEQAIVTRAIAKALAPLCRRLEIGETGIRRLRGLSHLKTPLEGDLSERRHLLELAGALHPTPAVGGWPIGPALAGIAACETTPRGWYAGPIGFFDRRGEGELRVALRCALLVGRRARLYAGAGLVAGSEPAAEVAEMLAKTETMLEALREPVHGPFTLTGQTADQKRPRPPAAGCAA